jgi:hypothetical protein
MLSVEQRGPQPRRAEIEPRFSSPAPPRRRSATRWRGCNIVLLGEVACAAPTPVTASICGAALACLS